MLHSGVRLCYGTAEHDTIRGTLVYSCLFRVLLTTPPFSKQCFTSTVFVWYGSIVYLQVLLKNKQCMGIMLNIGV